MKSKLLLIIAGFVLSISLLFSPIINSQVYAQKSPDHRSQALSELVDALNKDTNGVYT